MKKLLFILCIGMSYLFAYSQESNTSLNSPHSTIYNHLYYLQADHYNKAQSAKSFPTNFSLKEAKVMAVELKQILDAKGAYIDMNLVPTEENFLDSNKKARYFLIPNNKDIYLEKYGNKWYYSKSTSSRIHELHRATFPFGTAFFIKHLPHHLNSKILGIEQWQWLGIFILLISSAIVYFMVKFVVAKILISSFEKFGKHHFARKVIRPVTVPSGIIIASILFKALYPSLLLNVQINHAISIGLNILIPINALYILYQFANIFGLYLERIAEKTESKMDDQLVPIIRKSLKFFILIIGIVFILQNLNFNITGLLAGLSIGGLALALAAQDTVKNFIGSFMIFLDKPFQIGDWISADGIDGTVEEVGFRATRIRTFRNSVQYVPNGKLADMITDNNGKREYRRFNTNISIAYDTPTDKISAFTEGLRKMVVEDEKVFNDNFHIYLNSMADSSLNILFYIFFDVPDWGAELDAREAVLLKIIELAEVIDVRFAFPTQSLHIEDLPGRDSLTPIHNLSKEEMKQKIEQALEKFRSK